MPQEDIAENVRDLAAAVILQAMEDYQVGPGHRGQHRLRQLEARDFLCGLGKYAELRSMWCSEMGLSPDRLTEFVREADASGTISPLVQQLQSSRARRVKKTIN